MFSIARCCRNKLHSTLITKTLVSRQYMKVSDKMELLLRKADYIPHGYSLIYREKNYFGTTMGYHAANLVTSLTIAMVIYYICNEEMLMVQQRRRPFRPGRKDIETYQLCIIVAATTSFFLVVQTLRKRYPVRVYYSEKDKMYRAIFIGKIPFTTEFYNFPERCLTYVAKESISPWKRDTYNANGRKLLMFQDKFRTYSDFQEMLKPGEI